MKVLPKLIVALFLIISKTGYGQSEIYSKVKLNLSSKEDIQLLRESNIGIDHYHTIDKNNIEFIINQDELEILKTSNFNYEVIIKDCVEDYNQRSAKDKASSKKSVRTAEIAERFDYGSMGGYYSLSEIEEKLDEMSEAFPNIVKPKYSIGTSIEGRDIWAIKISDNPMVDEEEPAVYYDALHHAREPLSMAVTINFALWMVENYDKDEKIKYLIDNREIYVVPCVNPDGYEYNRQNNPNGGGFWRKNRKEIDDECNGVDLNRNYSYGFNYNGICSSSNACSEIYSGTDPFSEPETAAVRDFIESINPKIAFSTHSFGDVAIFPSVFDDAPDNFPSYSKWASEFLLDSEYPYGQDYQMIGYTSCGTTTEYFDSKGIYAYTLEVGDKFWPVQSKIYPYAARVLNAFVYQAWVAGQYSTVKNHTIFGDVISGSNFEMNVEVANKGLNAEASNIEVAILSNDSNVIISGDGNLGAVESISKATSQNFDISIGSSYTNAYLELTIVVTQDGIETDRETVFTLVGNQTVIFEDNAENGLNNWVGESIGEQWGVCEDDSKDGDFSFADSCGGNVRNGIIIKELTLKDAVDLSNTQQPFLQFYGKWSLADQYNNLSLLVSKDDGVTWTTIETFEEKREYWHQELFDLSAFKTENVKIRFQLEIFAPEILTDGVYFDKISITNYKYISGEEENEAVVLCPSNENVNICDANEQPVPLSLSSFSTEGNVNINQLNFEVSESIEEQTDFSNVNYTYTFTSSSGNQQTCEQNYKIVNPDFEVPNFNITQYVCQYSPWSHLTVGLGNYKIYADSFGEIGNELSDCTTPGVVCHTSALGVNTSELGRNKFWITRYFNFPDGTICESEAVPFSINVFERPAATLSTKRLTTKIGETINLMDLVTDNTSGFWRGKNIINVATADGESLTYFSSLTVGTYKLYYNVTNAKCENRYLLTVNVENPAYRIESKPQLTLYPNPANNKIFIDLAGTRKESNILSLQDINGTILLESNFKGKETSLDISNLPKGVYLLKVQNYLGITAEKLIKN